MRCRALPLVFAVLCCAALCVLLNIQQQLLVVVVVPGMIQIPGSCTCFVYSSFCFLQLVALSRSPCPPPRSPPRKYRTYCRSEHDINKHTAQRRAGSSAQAPRGTIIDSLFAPNNHGPLLPAPFIHLFLLVALFLARAKRAASAALRSGALCFL